ncbi:MAG: tetratricopeptide repeat protein, partial [Ktedonobacterales bacterium]|nr:tetratricopeptide repeat protein [Ktedonobacterales bacterium]
LAAYERALTLDPTLALAWQGKATVLFTLGRQDEAETAWARAAALNET